MNFMYRPINRPCKILLLQGPVGGFFGYLARTATSAGFEVVNVHFNLADRLFHCGGENLVCVEPPNHWDQWLEALCRERRFDAIIMFGDRRPVHIAACSVAERLGVAIYSFEEGYLRPDFITFERGGNNARSPLPRTRDAYDCEQAPPSASVMRVAPSFARMSVLAIGYFVALAVGRPLFPQYRHHRIRPLLSEGYSWLRNGVRKLTSAHRDKRVEQKLTRDHQKRFFIVALQVHDDLQLLHHAAGWTQERLIEASIRKFAEKAPSDSVLVVRCHPYDRGHRSYGALVLTVAEQFGVASRVQFMQTGHGPTLLSHAAGFITVNSTMALSALYHGCPVYAAGDSFYRIDGLVAGGRGEAGIGEFFASPGAVDRALFARFSAAVRDMSLINGSFYDRRHWHAVVQGVFKRLAEDGILTTAPASVTWRVSPAYSGTSRPVATVVSPAE